MFCFMDGGYISGSFPKMIDVIKIILQFHNNYSVTFGISERGLWM